MSGLWSPADLWWSVNEEGGGVGEWDEGGGDRGGGAGVEFGRERVVLEREGS